MDKPLPLLPLFRPWMPEWLVKVVLFSVLLPGLVLFFLPLANTNAAAGYYGSEPADIQFAVALFYSGYAGFYALERRFFQYLATKEYFIVITLLQLAVAYGCYQTQDLYVLFPLRFVQGILFASAVNLSLAFMFTRLRSERAREISFSVFFGMLICALPFNNLVTADLIDSFNFNAVYKGVIFSYVPGLLALLVSMNNIRLDVHFPLRRLDWQSFALYSIVLVLLGYIAIYGQEYYWLADLRIRRSVLAILGLGGLYVLRQRSLKRPYTALAIFRIRNYKIGLLLLFILYLCRFAGGITNGFFATVLRLDPMHVSYLNLLNLAGLVVGVVVAAALTLQQVRIRFIWLAGFGLLLGFHVVMFFLFDTQANEDTFYGPLFVQGLGIGLVMVPTIVFAIASVPVALGPSAAGICLAVRYMGYCASVALLNFFELLEKGRHYSAFQDVLTRTNPVVRHTLDAQAGRLLAHGLAPDRSGKAAAKLLVAAVNGQSQIRYAMDYYELMAWLLVGTLLLVGLLPYLNRTVVYLKSSRLVPA
ncbi:MFS transporter [Hymenobacter actinosclerus]|uniref:Beta-carotene 15,15'-monooxygenase n=1 Tax=Hymenobacter actinosclerus TaxID=82805 RepID=A0A1I0GER1_9BACT|nr:hypothetical protein [Hymenobacter actinosclerus]SET69428.1 hypothetical protein SAMN04487998_2373 [Hymenobacter actinosclerus]